MTRGRDLLEGIVDYAGLFPPTAWPMDRAVSEYTRQRASDAAWMLAAFVVPAARLGEMDDARSDSGAWPLSVLLGADPTADLVTLLEFLRIRGGRYELRAVEFRPIDAASVGNVVEAVPDAAEVFCELPWTADPAPWMPALRQAGAHAKIRTGGVTPDLVPPIEAVARFLRACAESGVGLKFTAGLHHPVRAEHALTYEEDAPRAVMHGFLNVFVAASLLAHGNLGEATLHAVLSETDPRAFVLDDDGGVRWRDHHLKGDDVRRIRSRFARSFGSCSFAEPVDDLQTLDLT